MGSPAGYPFPRLNLRGGLGAVRESSAKELQRLLEQGDVILLRASEFLASRDLYHFGLTPRVLTREERDETRRLQFKGLSGPRILQAIWQSPERDGILSAFFASQSRMLQSLREGGTPDWALIQAVFTENAARSGALEEAGVIFKGSPHRDAAIRLIEKAYLNSRESVDQELLRQTQKAAARLGTHLWIPPDQAAGVEQSKIVNAATWDVTGAAIKDRARDFIPLNRGMYINRNFSIDREVTFSMARGVLKEKAPEMILSQHSDGSTTLRFSQDGILQGSSPKRLDLKNYGLTLRADGNSTIVRLKISGQSEPQEFPIFAGTVNVYAGQNPAAVTDDIASNLLIQLDNAPEGVSRSHLMVIFSSGMWTVSDQSEKGTFVRALDAQKFKEAAGTPKNVREITVSNKPRGPDDARKQLYGGGTLAPLPFPSEGLLIQNWDQLRSFNLTAAGFTWMLSANEDGRSIRVASDSEKDPGQELPVGGVMAIGEDPAPADHPAGTLLHTWTSAEKSYSTFSSSTHFLLRLDPQKGLIIHYYLPFYGFFSPATLSMSKVRALQTAGAEQEFKQAAAQALNPAESLEWNLRAVARAVEQIRLKAAGSVQWMKAGIKGEKAFVAFEVFGTPHIFWFTPAGTSGIVSGQEALRQLSYAALLGGQIGPKKFSPEFSKHHPNEPSDFAITFTTGQILDQLLRRNGRVTLVLTSKPGKPEDNKKEVAERFARGAVGRYDGNDPMTFLWMIPGRVDVYFDQFSDPGEAARERLSAAGMKVKGVFATPEGVGEAIAGEVLQEWRQKVTEGDQYIFGLVTGSTPKPFLDALMPQLKGLRDQARSGLLGQLSIVVPDDHVEADAAGQFHNITRENSVSAFTTRENDFVKPANEGLPAGMPGMSMDRVMVPEVGKADTQLDQLPGIDRYFLTFGPQHVFMQFAGEAQDVTLFDPATLITTAGTEQVIGPVAGPDLAQRLAGFVEDQVQLRGPDQIAAVKLILDNPREPSLHHIPLEFLVHERIPDAWMGLIESALGEVGIGLKEQGNWTATATVQDLRHGDGPVILYLFISLRPSAAGTEQDPVPGEGEPASKNEDRIQEAASRVQKVLQLSTEGEDMAIGFLQGQVSLEDAVASSTTHREDLDTEDITVYLISVWIQTVHGLNEESLKGLMVYQYKPNPAARFHMISGLGPPREKNLTIEKIDRIARTADRVAGREMRSLTDEERWVLRAQWLWFLFDALFQRSKFESQSQLLHFVQRRDVRARLREIGISVEEFLGLGSGQQGSIEDLVRKIRKDRATRTRLEQLKYVTIALRRAWQKRWSTDPEDVWSELMDLTTQAMVLTGKTVPLFTEPETHALVSQFLQVLPPPAVKAEAGVPAAQILQGLFKAKAERVVSNRKTVKVELERLEVNVESAQAPQLGRLFVEDGAAVPARLRGLPLLQISEDPLVAKRQFEEQKATMADLAFLAPAALEKSSEWDSVLQGKMAGIIMTREALDTLEQLVLRDPAYLTAFIAGAGKRSGLITILSIEVDESIPSQRRLYLYA